MSLPSIVYERLHPGKKQGKGEDDSVDADPLVLSGLFAGGFTELNDISVP